MSTVGVSANRLEIMQIAKAVAEEKAIDRSIVIEAMQEAIEKAAKSRYGQEHDIRAFISMYLNFSSHSSASRMIRSKYSRCQSWPVAPRTVWI